MKGRSAESRTMEKIERAIAEFNKYHGKEAMVRLLDVRDQSFTVEMSGPFCRSCGVSDYFDDLGFEVEREVGKPVEIGEIHKLEDDSFRINYKIMLNNLKRR